MLSTKQSSLVFGVLLILSTTTLSNVFCISLNAQGTDTYAMSQDPCGTIEKLVRQFYPKAVINKGRGEITFEYKSKKKNGFYPDRPAMVPMDGGIVGTVTLSPGEYAEADKDEIPSEKPNGFYMVLTMAPYSKRQNSHLLAKVIFPEDINSEFKEKFRSLIKSFNATDQPPVTEAPKPENTTTTTTTTPAADTEAKPKPSYAWAVVVRPDYRISFKFPQKFTVKDSPDKSSTTWRGNAEGVDYTVTVHQPTAACISDEQRTQAMTKLVSGLIQGKKSKLEQSFNFQGLTAQQYAITDGSGITSKVIVCISAGLQYMFVAGGPNYKASKLPPEFFDGIKIGKVK